MQSFSGAISDMCLERRLASAAAAVASNRAGAVGAECAQGCGRGGVFQAVGGGGNSAQS
jgi:hypothetical protein